MKHSVQDQLSQDHRNIARLLGLMNHELDQVADAEVANMELLLDIMRYVTAYPDQVHHPLEDLMFESLYEREPELRERIGQMFDEHRLLAQKGGDFLHMLQTVVDGSMIERDVLVENGRAYADLLYNHMVYENEVVFPLADRGLSESDWTEVGRKFESQRDPLFGPIKDDDFASLLATIEDEAV